VPEKGGMVSQRGQRKVKRTKQNGGKIRINKRKGNQKPAKLTK